jgi:hypothetical protein
MPANVNVRRTFATPPLKGPLLIKGYVNGCIAGPTAGAIEFGFLEGRQGADIAGFTSNGTGHLIEDARWTLASGSMPARPYIPCTGPDVEWRQGGAAVNTMKGIPIFPLSGGSQDYTPLNIIVPRWDAGVAIAGIMETFGGQMELRVSVEVIEDILTIPLDVREQLKAMQPNLWDFFSGLLELLFEQGALFTVPWAVIQNQLVATEQEKATRPTLDDATETYLTFPAAF